ncbi:pentatricopeptide repeat-containing protein At1g61870, mitochondrial-like [Impatiens glandulifera]|uniref:pentatricopeptide repeat-containing protein At1g61870, mitochondrial-like n=1 Tax=Impatiens glandulifera TaxID=253017 RepID=UPI001FB07DF2|nr:pentatricopeptide repeat-containing protein At1g61870, mitochondrial-like [Impatiens glandulifera]
MGLISKIRFTPSIIHLRSFSSIRNPNSTNDKSHATLALLKSEKNPDRILEICRAASLSPDSHLDRISFSVAISKLAASNYSDGIRSYLEELKTKRPDLRNERFLSHAIVLYGQAGMIESAINTFEHMKDFDVSPSVRSLNALLFSCIVAKKYDEAKRVYLEFPSKHGIERNLITYNTIIKAFCESGSSSSVYSVIAEMDKNNCKPNGTTFGTLLAGFYKEEKYEDVGKVTEMMKTYGVTPGIGVYNNRIQILCKDKRSSEAKALLDGAIGRGLKANNESYGNLIHGFCKEGKLDEGKKIFETMRKNGCEPDSECYFTLIYFLCRDKDYEFALKITKECIGKNWFPNFTIMKTLVRGLGSVSMVDEAREIVGVLKKRFPSSADVWNEIEQEELLNK